MSPDVLPSSEGCYWQASELADAWRSPNAHAVAINGHVVALLDELAETADGERYPPRCSQCGQRWIDRPCGPTHAVVADRLGLNDLRIALVRLRHAVDAEGRSPSYHRAQKDRLWREWGALVVAIEALLDEAGEPLLRSWNE